MSSLNSAASSDPTITGVSQDDIYNELDLDVVQDIDLDEGISLDEDEGEPASSEEQPVEAASDLGKYRLEIDGEEREFSADEMQELYRGYLRQEDYTRKTQQMSEWYKQNEERIRAVQVLDQWMHTYPDRAQMFHKLLFEPDAVMPQQQQYTTRQVDPEDVLQVVDYPDQYQQQLQQQQHQQQLQQWWQQVHHAQEIQRQYEDLQLDYALKQLKASEGDFDETSLLHYMHVNQVYNPAVALHALRGQAGGQSRPTASPAPTQVPTQQVRPAGVVESSRSRGTRGIQAAQSSGQKEGPVRTKNWDEAHRMALQDFGD